MALRANTLLRLAHRARLALHALVTLLRDLLYSAALKLAVFAVVVWLKYDCLRLDAIRERNVADVRARPDVPAVALLEGDTFRLKYRLEGSTRTWLLVLPASLAVASDHSFVTAKPTAAAEAVARAMGPRGDWHGSRLTPATFGADSVAITDMTTFTQRRFERDDVLH